MIPAAAGDEPATDPDGTAVAVAVAAADGRVGTRSAADRALFGNAAGAVLDRFDDLAAGARLLDALRTGGVAEATLGCRTVAGPRRLRVRAVLIPDGGAAVLSFEPAGAEEAPAPPNPEGVPADRLARLGHELRSPLNAVLGFAEMIRHDARAGRLAPGRAAEYATDIVAAAWRLTGLADDMVALGLTQAGAQFLRMGEVDLARVARRVIRLAGPAAAAAGVRIDTGGLPAPGAGPAILGDEGALWSAVDNLLQNAIRHAGAQGLVQVALCCDGAEGGAVLEIADDGAGLERAALAEALAPGGQPGAPGAGPRRPGGLGLPIAAELIEAHDGVLEIDTASGAGLRARLRFPAARVLES